MKTIHVGGLSPFNRAKDFDEALRKAKDDDTIVLHKNITVAASVDRNIIIDGRGHTMTVKSGRAGLITNAPVEIENVKFVVESRANAMIINANARLQNVTTTIKGPIRAFYPTITVKNGHTKIYDSRVTCLSTSSESVLTLDNVEVYGYYGGDINLDTGDDLSFINGRALVTNANLSSIRFQGSVEMADTQIGQYVSIINSDRAVLTNVQLYVPREAPFVKLKSEPSRGPLSHTSDSRYCLFLDTADVTLNNYTVAESIDDYYGIFAIDSTILVQSTHNTEYLIQNSVENSTITFENSQDQNYWSMQNTTPALVRSTINSDVNMETAMDKLNKLIGLENVKAQITSIMNTIKVNQESGDDNFAFSNHMVFAGDPGTGKTTVAKIVAEALFEVGAVPENKLTNVTVDSLIKGYVGQTAANVREILDKAVGGVLFIDEAYQLTVKDQNTFNDEALSVLIRYMEDHRKDLVVIAAGYTKEMKEFLASNVGLSRRFQWIEFEDYTPEEMAQIFELVRESYKDQYKDPSYSQYIPTLFEKLVQLNLSHPDANGRVTNGGNGGLVRNVYQRIVTARNNRYVNGDTDKSISWEDIKTGFKVEMESAMRKAL